MHVHAPKIFIMVKMLLTSKVKTDYENAIPKYTHTWISLSTILKFMHTVLLYKHFRLSDCVEFSFQSLVTIFGYTISPPA